MSRPLSMLLDEEYPDTPGWLVEAVRKLEAEVERLREQIPGEGVVIMTADRADGIAADLDEAMRLLEVEPELLDGRWNADYAALRARVEARREGK